MSWRCLVQPGDSYKVCVSFLWRHAPLKTTPHGHATWSRAGGIGGQGAVAAVVVDELFNVGEESRWIHETTSSVSTTDQPSFD